MLTGVHIFLTYKCTLECDHCFVHSGPFVPGVMDLPRLRRIIGQARDLGTVRTIYLEGGEPFLYYALLLEGVRLAREAGFRVGIVTNSYWAVSVEDAALWLRPLAELGLADLALSDDAFHHGDVDETPAGRALAAARDLGIPASTIRIEKPFVEASPGQGQARGAAVVGGGAMFRGRAAETLVAGLPGRPWAELAQCPHEELVTPSRVHVDPYGHVHVCQGLSMGNLFERPLAELDAAYDAAAHPVFGPLARGGPAELARAHGFVSGSECELGAGYVDECHLCYTVRRALADRFPHCLAPRQVYGLDRSD